MKLLLLFIIIAIFCLASPVLADCIHNGISYPTGTQIGDYVCQPDGTWQK